MTTAPFAIKKMPTQADVARHAAVSQALVSYVLNDSRTISVPMETKNRILRVAAELGYVPNRAARSLRTRKTYTIAGIIPDITNPFFPAFQRGIQDVADRYGYDLLTYNTDGVAKKELKCLRSVHQGRVDGLVTVLYHMTASQLRPLLESNIAVVRFEAVKQETGDWPIDNLYVDNEAAARTAVIYLVDRGHRRIGMIAGQNGPRKARCLGYRRALSDCGIPVDDGLIQDGDFHEGGGQRAMQSLLKCNPPPTAVFATNDLMAMGALMVIKAAGLRVPEDIAVVGFDDIPSAKFLSPPLTTVALFPERLGQRAAEMVVERLRGAALGHGRCEEMPFGLIVRGSA